jgi:hypothetical protein
MAYTPPSDLNADGNSNSVSASKQPSGNQTDGTSVDTVFYPTLTFQYEEIIDYRPTWEITKACTPYDDDTLKAASKTRAAIAVGQSLTETDRKVVSDHLYIKVPHPDDAGDAWIKVGAMTASHKSTSDTTAKKTFAHAKVTTSSWIPQQGYRGKVTLNYYDSAEKKEKDKKYNFMTIGKLWKWVKSDSKYRWYGPMTRAGAATYAGYIMPRNKYVKDNKESADKKYTGAQASRSIWVIWQYRDSEWKQGVVKGSSGNTTSNVFIHPAGHFYHLEGCLAPCDEATSLSDEGFSSYTKSEAAMDDIFELAHGSGTTCLEPTKSKDVKWYRIVVKDIAATTPAGGASGGAGATAAPTANTTPVTSPQRQTVPIGTGGPLGASPLP